MFIEQLTKDDYDTLAVVFSQDIEADCKIERFSQNSILLKITRCGCPHLVLEDFNVQPINRAAIEFISTYNPKKKFFKYMTTKFGPEYYDLLMSHLKEEYDNLTSSLN